MSNIKRRVYRDTDDYVVRLEENNNVLFIHVEMKNINTAVMRHLKSEFEIFKSKIKSAGYKYIFSYSSTPKFYNMFNGCEEIGDIIWDEKDYKVLRWELN